MGSLVVPGRERSVIATILTFKVGISFEPAGITVDPANTKGRLAVLFAARRNAITIATGRQLVDIDRNVHKDPMIEIGPWQIMRNGSIRLVNICSN